MLRLPATGRLRIASAGAYHNVLVFSILLLLGRTGFGNRMLAIGYEDVSRLGKVVISIDDVRRGRPTLKQSHGLFFTGFSPERACRARRHDYRAQRLRFRIKSPP